MNSKRQSISVIQDDIMISTLTKLKYNKFYFRIFDSLLCRFTKII